VKYQTDFADIMSKETAEDIEVYARDIVDRFPKKAKLLVDSINKQFEKKNVNKE